jgi:hypothetical protein
MYNADMATLEIKLNQELEQRLLDEARRQQTAPEALVEHWVTEQLKPRKKFRDVSKFAGTWTAGQWDEFERNTESMRQVDAEHSV